VVREGEPRQEVVAAGQTRLQLVELGGLEAREREEEARRMATEEAGKPFDLSRGPLLRMVLLRLEEEQHILLCTMHHIICDGWSKGILIHEITAIYQAFICGGRLPLAEMPIQYADYAAWQRNYLRAETAREDLDYWKSQLAQAPPLLQMQADRPRPAVQTYAGGRENLRLPKKLFEDLKALSRKSGVTLFMMLLAAFKALVFRYTAQEDIVLGTSVAGRNKRETEDLIGFFVNMLVLRTRCSGNSTFQEILDRVRDDSLHAFAHQSVPFEMLVETLQPERNLSYSPLFQVLFSLQNAPASELCLPGLSLGFPELQTVAAKYDLLVDLWQDKDQLTCALEYNSDLFESASVRRLLLHYQRILESIVQSPERRIHELPLMSELELHEVIVERNRQQASYPADACVHELFEQAVKKYPERIALILRDEGLTYRELNSRANKTARYLQALGEGPGSLVGIYTEHSFAELIGILAVLKIGAGYVPFPPGIHREKLQSAIADASVRVILTAKKFFDSLEGLKVTPVCLDQERHAMESLNDHNLGIPASKEFIAYVIYTSGSTGEPKGVAVSHRALVNYLWWAKDAYKIDDYAGWALYSSIAFDLTVTSLYAALIQGAPLIIHSLSEEEPPLEKMLSNDRIGVLKVTPSHLLLMKDHEWARSATRCLVVGGEALSTKVAREIHNAFAGYVQIFNEYGPTEATVGCMIHRFDENSDRQFVPIGRAIPNMQIYVLDQFLNPVPENVVGELFVAGDGLAAGYVNRPEFTAERFLPNPFLSGHRMYRTGDLAKWLPEGEVEFLGRIDDQVKVRGFRVELGEVETVLSKHPKVRECALLLQEDVKGTRYLTACYVPQLTGALEDTELRRFMQERLPFYMVPGVYVEMDTLPKSRSGKVDRRALSANCTPGLAATKTYVAPSTPIEKAIAEIWASVLGVQKPGAQDNFFQLGGHSIMAIQITQRINQNFPVNLSMRTIFREPTIAGLAIVVEEMILDQLEFKAS